MRANPLLRFASGFGFGSWFSVQTQEEMLEQGSTWKISGMIPEGVFSYAQTQPLVSLMAVSSSVVELLIREPRPSMPPAKQPRCWTCASRRG